MKNVFVNNLTKSNKEIKESRASRIAQQVEMAQDELVRSVKTEVLDLEAKLEDLEDLSPESMHSLNPIKGEFKAKEWVEQLQSLKIQIANKKLELSIAEATYKKYFTEIEDGNSTTKKENAAE